MEKGERGGLKAVEESGQLRLHSHFSPEFPVPSHPQGISLEALRLAPPSGANPGRLLEEARLCQGTLLGQSISVLDVGMSTAWSV